MKPKDAFGRYGCVPRDLHPAWSSLSFYARSIAMALFARVDDFEDMHVDIHGPWMDSLCKQLEIPGKERRNAKRAMQQLVDGGFIAPSAGRVDLKVVPSLSPGCPVPRSVPMPVVVSDSPQVAENTQVTFDSQPAIKPAEDRVRVPARETVDQVIDLKPPVQTSAPAAKRAADKLHAITCRWYSPTSGKHVEALEELGSRPDSEWARAAEVIEREMTKPSVAGMMTPAHLRDNWGKYSNGEAPVGRAELKRRIERDEKPQARGVWAKAVAQ